MKILFACNAPWTKTGYGNQGASLSRRLRDAGHKVVYFCNYGLRGGVVEWEGITCLPTSIDEGYIDPIIQGHTRYVQPDLLLSLFDVWGWQDKPFPLPAAENWVRWAAWAPVDHEPISSANRNVLERVDYPISMCRFGHEQMTSAGIKNTYIPHGIEKDFHWTGAGRREFRRHIQVPDGAFLFGTVGLHYGWPNRKATERLFYALSLVDDCYLYIHGMPEPLTRHGMNLMDVAQFYGVQNRLRWADPYNYVMGYSQMGMNSLYSALDCYVQPTMGEGFGLPVLEAQACGCPVIATNCTSMPELVCPDAGILVEGERFLVPDLAHRTYVNIEKLAQAMRDMMAWQRENPSLVPVLRQTVGQWANNWDWDKLWVEEWTPFLAAVEDEVAKGVHHERHRGNAIVSEHEGHMRKADSTLRSPAVEKELALLLQLAHPNIIPVLAHGKEPDGTVWFDMPKHTPLSKMDAADLTLEQKDKIRDGVKAALFYLHERQLCHRDVEPSNVVLDADFNPYLLDFEWAHPCEDEPCVDFEPWKCPEKAVGIVQAGMEERGFHTILEYLYGKSVMLKRSKATGLAPSGVPYQPVEGIPGEERACEDRWRLMRIDPRGKTLLDVGCNAGWFVRRALEDGATAAVGIDADEAIIELARSLGPGVYHHMGISDVDADLGHFNIALVLSVLQHVPEPDVALRKVMGVAAEVYVEVPSRFITDGLADILKDAVLVAESERGRPIYRLASGG